jgi:molybdate transport system regulatory protein
LKHSPFHVRSKVWLEIAGIPFLGPGRRELLLAVDQWGSIQKAARSLKLSYRRAWGQISAMEKELGLPLVVKTTGGRGGGGAHLTPEAKEILDRYERLIRGIAELVDSRFREVFCGIR